jgi:hypothetical protein
VKNKRSTIRGQALGSQSSDTGIPRNKESSPPFWDFPSLHPPIKWLISLGGESCREILASELKAHGGTITNMYVCPFIFLTFTRKLKDLSRLFSIFREVDGQIEFALATSADFRPFLRANR